MNPFCIRALLWLLAPAVLAGFCLCQRARLYCSCSCWIIADWRLKGGKFGGRVNWNGELLFGISGGGVQRCRGTAAVLVKNLRFSRDMLEVAANRFGSSLGTTSTSASSGCGKPESCTEVLWRSGVIGSTPISSSLSSSSPALRARFRWSDEANLSRLWSSLSTWLNCIPTLVADQDIRKQALASVSQFPWVCQQNGFLSTCINIIPSCFPLVCPVLSVLIFNNHHHIGHLHHNHHHHVGAGDDGYNHFNHLRQTWNLQPGQCLVTVETTGHLPPFLQTGGRFLSGTLLNNIFIIANDSLPFHCLLFPFIIAHIGIMDKLDLTWASNIISQ